MKTFNLQLTILVLLLFTYIAKAQEDAPKMLTLEELMSIQVESASKKAEDLFFAPSAASVVTSREMARSGATSIMEALRLLPGVIVREQTNGTYDIHVRGYDYIPTKNSMPYSSNLITLVMIDGRAVFRDFQGGTYWEALPVDIADVERIELIRGPSSALYGANAVAGVINIITKNKTDNNFAKVDAQQGTHSTGIYNASVGYTKDKMSLMVTGNYQKRERFQSDYYDYVDGVYKSEPDSIYSVQTGAPGGFRGTGNSRYPNKDLAMDKIGGNAYLNYTLNDDVSFDLSMGAQKSFVHKVYVDVIHTPFTMEKSESEYINFKAKANGFNLQTSYLTGYQNTIGVMGWEFDFNTFDFNLEYEHTFAEKLSIRSGINYRKATFDDEKGVRNSPYGLGLVNGKYDIETKAFSLRFDYKPIYNLRFVAAIRADKYNYPEDLYLSYQLAATYTINDMHLFRVGASRANKGANIMETYVDFNYLNFMVYEGNKDLKMMTLDQYELGYRGKFSEKVHLDFELFYSKAKDFANATIMERVEVNPASPYGITNYFKSLNTSVKPEQMGTTVSLNIAPSTKLQFKPFITYQKTELKDFNKNYANLTMEEDVVDEEHEWTPSVFGGFYINYAPNQKFNLNLTSYFYGENKFYYLYGKDFTIDSQIIINGKISYNVTPEMALYLNVRNINLADKKQQFAFAEEIKEIILFGATFEF